MIWFYQGVMGPNYDDSSLHCNLTPSSSLDDKTPEEMWTGRMSYYSHLKTFGCAACPHQNVGKLEPRSLRYVITGYLVQVKGYRLWAKESKGFKMIISRDVTFNESHMPCLSTKNDE